MTPRVTPRITPEDEAEAHQMTPRVTLRITPEDEAEAHEASSFVIEFDDESEAYRLYP
jgi:hypothetical protein